MPCISLFQKQKQTYQEEILPTNIKTFVIEASSSYSWDQFVENREYLITVDQFGKSGKKENIMKEFGFTVEQITEKIENLLK